MFTLTGQDIHGVAVLTPKRTEYAKEVRKEYEKGNINIGMSKLRKYKPRDDGFSNTLSGVQKDNLVFGNMRIRRLTPTECERLQGFPDGWTQGVSDTQRYKLLGNAVTVNVIEFLGEKLLEVAK